MFPNPSVDARLFSRCSHPKMLHVTLGRGKHQVTRRRPVNALDQDPAVVPIVDDSDGFIDEWLRSLMRDEPIELSVSGAELVAEARAEQE